MNVVYRWQLTYLKSKRHWLQRLRSPGAFLNKSNSDGVVSMFTEMLYIAKRHWPLERSHCDFFFQKKMYLVCCHDLRYIQLATINSLINTFQMLYANMLQSVLYCYNVNISSDVLACNMFILFASFFLS